MPQEAIVSAELTTSFAEAGLSEEPWDLCNDASFRSSPEAGTGNQKSQRGGVDEDQVSATEGEAGPEITETPSPSSDPSPTRRRKGLLMRFIPVDRIPSGPGVGTGAVSLSSSTASLPGTTAQDGMSDTLTLTPSSVPLSARTLQLIAELGYTSPDPGSNLPRSFLLALANRFTTSQLVGFKEEAEMNFTQPLPYFFSGSFMFPSALRAATNGLSLTSIARKMTPATLHGYRRAKVRNQPWPAMEEQEGGKVKGMLLFGMLEGQRKAIHRFEGGMFDLRRTKVEFEGKDGEKLEVEAGVYVWNQERSSLCGEGEGEEWRIEDLLASQWFGYVIRRAEEEERDISLHGVEL